MNSILLNFLFVVIGLVLLTYGASSLVNGASSLAKRFHIPDIIIGLTVVAMGTSAPEFVVNIISGSVQDGGSGANEVVFGNIIGSNIFNIFLILGVVSIIYPITVDKDTLEKEIPYSLLVTLVVLFLVNDMLFFDSETNLLDFKDGIILLVMFIAFIGYIFTKMKKGSESEVIEDIKIYGNLRTILMITLGCLGLIFGGKLIVDNAVAIAHFYDVSDKIIGITILSAGTSLPELATSIVASLQKKPNLIIGNIIGSNIFNILLVLGFTSIVHSPLVFTKILNADILVVVLGTFMIFIFMVTLGKNKLDRIEGIAYLLIFIAYYYYVFVREDIFPALF